MLGSVSSLVYSRLSDVLGQVEGDNPSLANNYFNQAGGVFLHPHLVIR